MSQIDAAVVKSTHHVAPHEDDAAPDEADAGHNLRGDARRIEHNPAVLQDIHEPVFRDQHKQGRGDADEGVSSKTRALLANLPLQTHQSGQRESECQLRQLQPPLAGEVQKPRQSHFS